VESKRTEKSGARTRRNHKARRGLPEAGRLPAYSKGRKTMRRDKKDIPIKKILIITFVLAMLISIAVIEYLVFSNWYSSSKRITESIAEDICASIHDQINSFIRIPYHMNEAGHKFIGKGILDLADDELRDKFFVTLCMTTRYTVSAMVLRTASITGPEGMRIT
jgi:hypothetical protein